MTATMDDHNDELPRRVADLEDRLEQALATLATQRTRVDELESRDRRRDTPRVDAGVRRGSAPVGVPAGDPAPSTTRPARRDLMRTAGLLAAGAVAGGAVAAVGSAAPAGATTTSFSGNPAIDATGVGGAAIHATTNVGSAVSATSNNNGATIAAFNANSAGIGIIGEGGDVGVEATSSGTGSAVLALGEFGIGVEARVGSTAKAQLLLSSVSPLAVPTTRSDFHQHGEVYLDNANTLWLCATDGSPGTWRRLGGASTAGSLTVLPTTTRIYDSRAGANPTSVQKGIFVNHEERVIVATLGGAVPAGATAVLMNATATNTNPGGFFAFFKNGTTWSGNSSLSWGLPGSTIANLAVVAVDSLAKFKARCEGVGGADLIVDCIGYYQ